jgi:hypothetical protein
MDKFYRSIRSGSAALGSAPAEPDAAASRQR